MTEIRERIKSWWHGETTPYEGEMIVGFYVTRHWTSKLAHTLADFWLEHWKWIVATLIAVFAIIVAAMRSHV
jgi:hypothetical protein